MVVLTECGLVRSVAFCRAAAVAWSWHRILQAPAVPGQLLQNSFAFKKCCAVLCHIQLQQRGTTNSLASSTATSLTLPGQVTSRWA